MYFPGSCGFDKWRNAKHRFSDLPPSPNVVISESNSKFLLDSTLQFQMIDYLCSISWPKIFPLSVNKLRLTLFHQVIPFSAEKSSAEPFLPQMAVIMVPSKAIVADLMASATQQWLDGANSIKVPERFIIFALVT